MIAGQPDPVGYVAIAQPDTIVILHWFDMNRLREMEIRQVVVLRQVDGLRHKEIAERLSLGNFAESESLYQSGLAYLRRPENYEFAALVNLLKNRT